MEDSQPKRKQDAERVKEGLVELGDKQIGALEALDKSAHSLNNALLQGEFEEIEGLSDLGRVDTRRINFGSSSICSHGEWERKTWLRGGTVVECLLVMLRS